MCFSPKAPPSPPLPAIVQPPPVVEAKPPPEEKKQAVTERAASTGSARTAARNTGRKANVGAGSIAATPTNQAGKALLGQ